MCLNALIFFRLFSISSHLRLLPDEGTVATKFILFTMLVFVAITSLWPIPSTQSDTKRRTRISFEIFGKKNVRSCCWSRCATVVDDDRVVHCFYRLFTRSCVNCMCVFSIDLDARRLQHSFIEWVICLSLSHPRSFHSTTCNLFIFDRCWFILKL